MDTRVTSRSQINRIPVFIAAGSDNILITYKKISISFDFIFGKRFLSNDNWFRRRRIIRHSSFSLILELMQPEIEAFLLHQIGMLTAFDDPAPVEHDDSIGMADGGEPVGDNQ